jgi:hypothetical protein
MRWPSLYYTHPDFDLDPEIQKLDAVNKPITEIGKCFVFLI